jgi:type IV secretory pathway VirB2 component (pilin)
MPMLISLYLFLSSNAFARSLKATADKLAQETTRIGHGVALFGLVVAGIYFMIGKQDAATKMTQALMGVGILMLSPSIITFVKGLV